jgi:hypothetical protein
MREPDAPIPRPPTFVQRSLAIGTVLVLAPLAALLGAVFYFAFVPAHSAEFHIAEIDTTVALRFYWTWSGPNEEGRYLTVASPHGRVTQQVCGWDWAHWSRTSVYLTPEHAIAVIGPDQCEYLVANDPPAITSLVNQSSDLWKYLGAFDLAGYPRGGHGALHLRFVRAEDQDECIVRGAQPLTPRNDAPREHARQRNCPFPPEG